MPRREEMRGPQKRIGKAIIDSDSLSSSGDDILIANTIREIGFNCVRLPFSLEQYYQNPYVDVRFKRNDVHIIILSLP